MAFNLGLKFDLACCCHSFVLCCVHNAYTFSNFRHFSTRMPIFIFIFWETCKGFEAVEIWFQPST